MAIKVTRRNAAIRTRCVFIFRANFLCKNKNYQLESKEQKYERIKSLKRQKRGIALNMKYEDMQDQKTVNVEKLKKNLVCRRCIGWVLKRQYEALH